MNYLIFLKSLSSGNEFIDKFFQEVYQNSSIELKWFSYDGFKNVKYLDKGGFGTIYTATWSGSNTELVLKSLNNSNEDLNGLLNEVYCLFLF